MTRFAVVEGGGTTFKAAIALDNPTNIIIGPVEWETKTPEITLAEVKKWLSENPHDALAVICFGPLDLNPLSPTYGYITSTPKPGWMNTNVLGALKTNNVPVIFETDVNAPAIAEFEVNNPKGTNSCAYITVGTGVGVGLVVNGKTVHGLLHPEGGHVRLSRLAFDSFKGTCPFHSDCVEGLCSNGALSERVGCSRNALKNLPDDHEVWDSCAHGLASLCATLILLVSPERIVLSGGIMRRTILFEKIQSKTVEILNGYIQHEKVINRISELITPSPWGDSAGIIGGLVLAKSVYDEHQTKNPKNNKGNHGSCTVLPQIAIFGIGVLVGFGIFFSRYKK